MNSAGNVKFKYKEALKMIQSKLAGLQKYFAVRLEHFIFIYADADFACLADAVYDEADGMFKVQSIRREERRSDDELFYQEILYRFCRDRNIQKAACLICASGALTEHREYEFPIMSAKEIEKALRWELADTAEEWSYGYECTAAEQSCVIQAALCRRSLIRQWREAAEENGLELADVFCTSGNNLCPETVLMDDEYRADITGAEQLAEALASYGNKTAVSLLGAEERPRLRWKRICCTAAAAMLAVTAGIAAFCISSYSTANEKAAVLQEKNALLASERKQIDELKLKKAQIDQRRAVLAKLYDDGLPLYPIVVQLAGQVPDGVQLTALQSEDLILRIAGKAQDYKALAGFRQKLKELPGLQQISTGSAQLDESGRLIDFSFNAAVNRRKNNEPAGS